MRHSDGGYRPDIDGLRAVAVTAVLVFHAFPAALAGGYVGVDVFFVISGYLITSILLAEIGDGNFSIVRFYVRRARRLFPALLVVLLATAAACWAFMLGMEWRNAGKHLLAGSTYLSNVVLWSEVGYFDPQAESKPLLHLWSLAVEEQFYLVWPLLLWSIYRILPRRALILTAVLAATSLVLCILVTRSSQPTAFYLPLTRFWELAAGGLLAMYGRKGRPASRHPGFTQAAGLLGLSMIVTALALSYRPGTFPGAMAIWPVAGAVLIISAGPQSFVNRYVLGSTAIVYVGRISYPLYLWHWPIFSLAFLLRDGSLDWKLRLTILSASLALAAITERIVERPFRLRVSPERAFRQARNLWFVTAVLGALGAMIWIGLLPARAQSSAAAAMVESAKRDWTAPETAHIKRNPNALVLLVGDSHMQQYWPRVEALAGGSPDRLMPSIELMSSSGCAPLPGLSRVGLSCSEFVSKAFERARSPKVERVVFAASWPGLASRTDLHLADDPQQAPIDFLGDAGRASLARWTEELAALRRAGKDVVVVLSTPRGPDVRPDRLYDRWTASATDVSLDLVRTDLYALVAAADEPIRNAALAAGVRIVEPFDWFCKADICRLADDAGNPAYTDDSHLRASYVSRHAAFLDELLQ